MVNILNNKVKTEEYTISFSSNSGNKWVISNKESGVFIWAKEMRIGNAIQFNEDGSIILRGRFMGDNKFDMDVEVAYRDNE